MDQPIASAGRVMLERRLPYSSPLKRTCIPCPRQRGTGTSSLDCNGWSTLTTATDAKWPLVLILAQLAAIAAQLPGRSALLAGNLAERTTTHSGFLDLPTNQIEGSTSGLPCQDIS